MSHLDELLSVFLDGEATPPEAAHVHGHLHECLRCRRRLADLNAARAAVRSLPTLEMPPGLVPEAAAAPPPHRRRSMWIGAAAAVAAAVIALATVLTTPPEPLNLTEVTRQLGARASLDSGAAAFKVVLPVGELE